MSTRSGTKPDRVFFFFGPGRRFLIDHGDTVRIGFSDAGLP